MRVTAAEGDITAFDVDVIVNAANNRMRGGGGVDGAIHRAGGPTILEDCIARFPNGLPTGEAGWTTAGDLSARWVVHVVGPIHGLGERRQLVSCYRHAMSVADELGAKTVAFPLVSTGVYGWPLEDAVDAAFEGIMAIDTAVEHVHIVSLGAHRHAAVETAIKARLNRQQALSRTPPTSH
ncbi:MAG: macro domain-containing protein [Nocardioides sp.]